MTRRVSHLCTAVVGVALLSLGAVACGGATQEQPTDSAAPAQESPAKVDVAIEGDNIVMPESVESEPVTFTFTNSFKRDLFVAFARLNEGVTSEKLDAAFKKSPDAAFPLIAVAGGFTHTKPGATVTVTSLLPTGTYIAVDPEAGDALKPAYFEVTEPSGPEVAEPEADATIEAGDFYFKIGDVPAGGAEVLIENTGQQGHEVVISNVSGKKPKEAGFYFAPPPGGQMWVTLDLQPGNYEAVCYFPDPKSGKPHIKLGMRAEFAVN